MLHREDMLELTRRMTPQRSTFTRIAGTYRDEEGFEDGSFNVNFLNLSAEEKKTNLELARAVPFSETNEELTAYRFPEENRQSASMRRLLDGMISCGLKNDVLMETFFDVAAEAYRTEDDYAVFVFHNRYDIPRKGSDHAYQDESEEVYEFLIAVFCPLAGEYEPGLPECGFLYPSFADRSRDLAHIAVFQSKTGRKHPELLRKILGINYD